MGCNDEHTGQEYFSITIRIVLLLKPPHYLLHLTLEGVGGWENDRCWEKTIFPRFFEEKNVF